MELETGKVGGYRAYTGDSASAVHEKVGLKGPIT